MLKTLVKIICHSEAFYYMLTGPSALRASG